MHIFFLSDRVLICAEHLMEALWCKSNERIPITTYFLICFVSLFIHDVINFCFAKKKKKLHCTRKLQESADLVTFTEEILNGKLHFLCNGQCYFATNVLKLYVMRCAIWHRLYNFKNVKNTHGGYYPKKFLMNWYVSLTLKLRLALSAFHVKIFFTHFLFFLTKTMIMTS